MSRFKFGRNWQNFIAGLDDNRIEEAQKCLESMIGCDLAGKSFLDIGSGSGLMSLAAWKAGAKVRSFDYDPDSVACSADLKQRFAAEDPGWEVSQGDVLDREFVDSLAPADIVYSWGVLHHTGSMWGAITNAESRVTPGGICFIAIYNDQGRSSRLWTAVKKLYVASPRPVQFLIAVMVLVRSWARSVVMDLLKRGNPLYSWKQYRKNRGMSPWYDAVDWAGGYPFEVAKPEEIFRFFRDRNYEMLEMTTCAGGLGCNEFVFRKKS